MDEVLALASDLRERHQFFQENPHLLKWLDPQRAQLHNCIQRIRQRVARMDPAQRAEARRLFSQQIERKEWIEISLN
jgi:hypothetical protein